MAFAEVMSCVIKIYLSFHSDLNVAVVIRLNTDIYCLAFHWRMWRVTLSSLWDLQTTRGQCWAADMTVGALSMMERLLQTFHILCPSVM